ncbi:hypothetical protein ACHAXA_010715 [Cyclostephanos tholiformis]|uniref:Uncharacterized protein n=1 Tax=Cyclostephanos tholiformis TaxID=382380 RepID=A0ABD3RQ57_9STRA
MSLDEALPMAGPAAPDRDGGNVRRGGTIGALAGLWARQGKYVKIGLVSLGLMTLGAIISVMIVKLGFDQDDNNITIRTTTPSASPTISIWKQQGVAIVGDAADDLLGNSVAVSADASTIVVGARGNHENDSKTGYVKVYRTIDDSGNMVQLGQTIYGDVTGDQFGWSVDIAANENTIVIGSPGYWDVDDRPGYMRVFSLDNDDDIGTNTWKQIGQDIIGEEDGDDFGWSVSISGDSKTIAVGADEYDGENGIDSGLVRVYRMDDSQSDWIQIGNDIEGEAAGDWLGSSVSLPADGNKVAIGSAGSDDNGDFSGHVIVYQMNSARSSWEQLGQTLYGDNADDFSGWSVDLSPDGKTLAIGSPGSSDGGDRPGYVRVFSLKVSGNNSGTSSWEQIGLDIFGEAKGDLFGMTVSLSNDGRTIAIGATNNDGEDGVDSGHVRVYRMDDSKSDWVQIGDDIDGDAPYDTSGTSVSLSADGDTVAIGSDWNDENGAEAGHVQVYILE